MTAVNAAMARKNLYQLIANVNDSRTPITIMNARGKNAVLLSEDDWRSIEETLYLNAIPNMAESILAADDERLSECATYNPDEEW